jgi:hypothetical protein
MSSLHAKMPNLFLGLEIVVYEKVAKHPAISLRRKIWKEGD